MNVLDLLAGNERGQLAFRLLAAELIIEAAERGDLENETVDWAVYRLTSQANIARAKDRRERETRTTFVGRHAITVKVEQILRNRTYDRHPETEELFNEMLDDVDEAVRSEVFHG